LPRKKKIYNFLIVVEHKIGEMRNFYHFRITMFEFFKRGR